MINKKKEKLEYSEMESKLYSASFNSSDTSLVFFQLMTFSLFASNAFEILHFGGYYRWTNKSNVVKLRYLAATLIILNENLNILNILEFHVTQINCISRQIFRINAIEEWKLNISKMWI